MKKLFLLLLIVPIVSFGQTPYSSYYENGNLKEKGPGYYEAIKYKISAKSGLNLRENPDLRSKKIAKIPYNTAIYLKDKPGIKLTVFDTDKKTGITKPIEGEWVKIGAEFYLNPGDEGYAIDLIDPSSVEGYVFDGFIEKEKYLLKKQGLWTYYYESGVIKKESLGGKIINYDIDGDITEILEGDLDDLWGRSVKVTFYKNGKAKSISESDGGGAIFTEIDKNGNKLPKEEEGEICIKGDHISREYLNIEMSDLFFGEYFRTGDIGLINKKDYIVLKGRLKEIINIGGKKLSPIEVEDKIKEFDPELEAVCIGIPDTQGVLGEVVKAFVVKGNSIYDFEEIDNFLKKKLEKYKIPLEYEWINEVPKTSSGKIQRQKLK